MTEEPESAGTPNDQVRTKGLTGGQSSEDRGEGRSLVRGRCLGRCFPIIGRISIFLSHVRCRTRTSFKWRENVRRKRLHSSSPLMMWLSPTIHASVSPESVWVLYKQQLSIGRQRSSSSSPTPAAWFLSKCVPMSSGAFRKRKRSSSFPNRGVCGIARISRDILALHAP